MVLEKQSTRKIRHTSDKSPVNKKKRLIIIDIIIFLIVIILIIVVIIIIVIIVIVIIVIVIIVIVIIVIIIPKLQGQARLLPEPRSDLKDQASCTTHANMPDGDSKSVARGHFLLDIEAQRPPTHAAVIHNNIRSMYVHH